MQHYYLFYVGDYIFPDTSNLLIVERMRPLRGKRNKGFACWRLFYTAFFKTHPELFCKAFVECFYIPFFGVGLFFNVQTDAALRHLGGKILDHLPLAALRKYL